MKAAKFNFTFTDKYEIETCTADPGATQTDAAKAITVLTRMRKAVEALKPTLPLTN